MVSFKLLSVVLVSICLSNARSIETLPISMDGRCGEGIAICREGFCCSKLGWCGNSDLHCKIEEGCQVQFGMCRGVSVVEEKPTEGPTEPVVSEDEEPTETIINDDKGDEFDEDSEDDDVIAGKCGIGYGSCKEGYCCSKYGWCGKSEAYCDLNLGCQSEFGICDNDKTVFDEEDSEDDKEDIPSSDELPISKDGKCGEGIAVCGEGYCCSKFGWCGKTDLYCNIEEGCQSEFGICNPPKANDNNEKPRESDDQASDDELPISKDGRCGPGIAVCGDGNCCSSFGWCGKTDDYCKIEKGCQPDYGNCTSTNASGKDESNDDDNEESDVESNPKEIPTADESEDDDDIDSLISDAPEVSEDENIVNEAVTLIKTVLIEEFATESGDEE
ncbi:carbohydrate-binding module family 18 protein [Piromyces sp. E2]|nr:carbohydrate-binding module family 18 protein [Piromyces sp. E2]|eukprot:OUM57545.1 carbohydrate-binding module family 18 protein [Piromyces sp. E2]